MAWWDGYLIMSDGAPPGRRVSGGWLPYILPETRGYGRFPEEFPGQARGEGQVIIS
jgi:hypothetical protein